MELVPSAMVAGLAFFVVMLAETSRLPVDNQETHLELTMIHEAMTLEYSGPSLALIEMSSYIKQVLFMTLVMNMLLPPAAATGLWPSLYWAGCAVFAAKILFACLAVAVLEVTVAKMRLFRAADFLLFGFLISAVAFILAVMGL